MAHKTVVYADNVNLLGENIKKRTEALLDASRNEISARET